MADDGPRGQGRAERGASREGLLAMDAPQPNLHSSDDNPEDPAFAESSDEEETVLPRRKRLIAAEGRKGANKRRQIVDVSSGSDDGGGQMTRDLCNTAAVDLCNSSVELDDEDSEEDSDGDSSDADRNPESSTRRGAASSGSRATGRGYGLGAMGELQPIPPFTGGARGVGRGAVRAPAAGAAAGAAGGGGSGSSAVVNLAISSDSDGDSSDDSSDSEGGENFIPLTRAPKLSASSLRGASSIAGSKSAPMDEDVEVVQRPVSRAPPVFSGCQPLRDSRGIRDLGTSTGGGRASGSREVPAAAKGQTPSIPAQPAAGKDSALSLAVQSAAGKDSAPSLAVQPAAGQGSASSLAVANRTVARPMPGPRSRGGGEQAREPTSSSWLPISDSFYNEEEAREGRVLSRLWPNPSRFYRAVLRWVLLLEDSSIAEDRQSAQRMANLAAVPTEFATLLDYQKIMCQLILKEALAGLQQQLNTTKSKWSKLVPVAGEAMQARLFNMDGRDNGEAGKKGNGAAGKKGKKGKGKKGKGKAKPPPSTTPPPSSSSSSDGQLYSLLVNLDPTPMARYGGGKELTPSSPFGGNDLVAISSPRWNTPGKAYLGVVQAKDLVHYTPATKSPNTKFVQVRVLICASQSGGDGVGGPGGWIPLAHVREFLGLGKRESAGVPITMSSVGSLMTAAREFQAVMSVSGLDEGVQQCLLDPASFCKDYRAGAPRRVLSYFLNDNSTYNNSCGQPGSSHPGVVGNAAPKASRPPSVPPELWRNVVREFNPSQVHAIRKAVEGSPSGFTLLQGPPGTGKTRTIMGIVGALLAGGCPYPGHSKKGGGAALRKPGARIVVGASIGTVGTTKRKGKKAMKTVKSPVMKASVRVLVVAPSNAAVDELVLRLCNEGVPGANGAVYFPKVVRVGGGRADEELHGEGGGGGGRRAGGGKGGGGDGMRSTVIEEVSLERLVEQGKNDMGGQAKLLRLSVLLQAEVVCATLSGSGSSNLVEAILTSAKAEVKNRNKALSLGGLGFDAVVMDEAAQAVEPCSLIPLKFNPRAVVMVGDPAQLPATIFSQEAKGANYGQSLFQRLQRAGHPKMMLDTQYRMHPDIASFASNRFYNGLLRSAPTVTITSHRQNFHLPRFAPYLFHNVPIGRVKRGGEGSTAATSLSNQVEVDYIASLLKDLVTTFPQTDFNGRIGIIAPYRNQIQALQRAIWWTGLRPDGVEVSTVDGFQGREKDIMVFSCVRAPEENSSEDAAAASGGSTGGIGFLDDWRRLNVAITRAKYAMWIIGHAGVLKQSTEWRELINDSKKRQAYVDSGTGAPSTGAGSGSGDTKCSSRHLTWVASNGTSIGSVLGKHRDADPPSISASSAGPCGGKGDGSPRVKATSANLLGEAVGRDSAAGSGKLPTVGRNAPGPTPEPRQISSTTLGERGAESRNSTSEHDPGGVAAAAKAPPAPPPQSPSRLAGAEAAASSRSAIAAPSGMRIAAPAPPPAPAVTLAAPTPWPPSVWASGPYYSGPPAATLQLDDLKPGGAGSGLATEATDSPTRGTQFTITLNGLHRPAPDNDYARRLGGVPRLQGNGFARRPAAGGLSPPAPPQRPLPPPSLPPPPMPQGAGFAMTLSGGAGAQGGDYARSFKFGGHPYFGTAAGGGSLPALPQMLPPLTAMPRTHGEPSNVPVLAGRGAPLPGPPPGNFDSS